MSRPRGSGAYWPKPEQLHAVCRHCEWTSISPYGDTRLENHWQSEHYGDPSIPPAELVRMGTVRSESQVRAERLERAGLGDEQVGGTVVGMKEARPVQRGAGRRRAA